MYLPVNNDKNEIIAPPLEPLPPPNWHHVISNKFNQVVADGVPLKPFSNSVAEIFYNLGREWTRPWSFGLKHTVRLFFQGNTSAEKIVNKIKSIALAILVVMTLPLALPGILLRLCSFPFQKVLTYSPGTVPLQNFPEENENDVAIRVMTWNTALGPGYMTAANGMRFSEERISSIVEVVEKTIAPFKRDHGKVLDVLCFQEVFDPDAAEMLTKKLNSLGYDCIHDIDPRFIGLSSGLFMAVKKDAHQTIRINRIASWRFTNGEGMDASSNKGLLGVELSFKGRSFYVFNTHLQASYTKESYDTVRGQQLLAVLKTSVEWAGRQSQMLICGDMNYSRIPLEDSNKASEYVGNGRLRKLHDFQDRHEGEQVRGDGSFSDPKVGKRSGALLDYIFSKGVEVAGHALIDQGGDLFAWVKDEVARNSEFAEALMNRIIHEVSRNWEVRNAFANQELYTALHGPQPSEDESKAIIEAVFREVVENQAFRDTFVDPKLYEEWSRNMDDLELREAVFNQVLREVRRNWEFYSAFDPTLYENILNHNAVMGQVLAEAEENKELCKVLVDQGMRTVSDHYPLQVQVIDQAFGNPEGNTCP